MSELLKQLLTETQESMASDVNKRRSHGERFIVQVTGQEVINGQFFLVGNEVMRGFDNVKIHVPNPPAGTMVSGGDGVAVPLRNYSDLMVNNVVVENDVVCFTDVHKLGDEDNLFVAAAYSTPMNKIESEGVIKDTNGFNGYMTLETVSTYPSVVLYQSRGVYSGTLADFKRDYAEAGDRQAMIEDGAFVPRLDSKEDIISWAQAQFRLRRPTTIRLIVDTGEGNYQTLPVRVNATFVDKPSQSNPPATYKEIDADLSLKSFLDNQQVKKLFALFDKISALPGVKVGSLHEGAKVMVEGIPTMKIRDQYKAVVDQYTRDKANVFKSVQVSYGENTVNESVCAQAMLLVRTSVLDLESGPITLVRVAPGSGLLTAEAEMYTLANMPSSNFSPSSPTVVRNVDVELKSNFGAMDDPAIQFVVNSWNKAPEKTAVGDITKTASAAAAIVATGASAAISDVSRDEEPLQPQIAEDHSVDSLVEQFSDVDAFEGEAISKNDITEVMQSLGL